MNAEAFTLKARRTTRVPLRVPVQVAVEEDGQWKTLDGWTVIVNIHGAKIECKRRMAVGDVIKVTVPLTRKSQTGKVVWSNEAPNSAGNYEFALELTEPGNLWGVGFPPSDWREAKAATGPVAVVSKAPSLESVAPAAGPENSAPQQASAAPKKITVAGYELKPILPFAVNKSDAAREMVNEPVQVAEVVEAAAVKATVEQSVPQTDIAPAPLQPEPFQAAPSFATPLQPAELTPAEAPLEELPMAVEAVGPAVEAPLPMDQLLVPVPEVMPALEVAPEASLQERVPESAVNEVAAELLSMLGERMPQPVVAPAFPSQPEIPVAAVPESRIEIQPAQELQRREAREAAAPHAGAALAAQSEAAEAAFQTRIDGLIRSASARIDAHLADVETAMIQRIDKKLNHVSEDHYERLDQHCDSLVAARSLKFEQALNKFSEATDEAVRNRHQEMISRADQELRRRASEINLHAQTQLQRHANEASQTAQSAMAAKLQDLLIGIDQEIGERCRERAEETHKLHRAQFEGALSARIEEARGYWQEQMEAMQEQASASLALLLENYLESQGKNLLQQMDQALAQMAGQIQKTFFKHVVEELGSQQHAWTAQLRGDVSRLSHQGVVYFRQQLRQELRQVLGAMGEALAQDAGSMADPAVTASESAPKLQELIPAEK